MSTSNSRVNFGYQVNLIERIARQIIGQPSTVWGPEMTICHYLYENSQPIQKDELIGLLISTNKLKPDTAYGETELKIDQLVEMEALDLSMSEPPSLALSSNMRQLAAMMQEAHLWRTTKPGMADGCYRNVVDEVANYSDPASTVLKTAMAAMLWVLYKHPNGLSEKALYESYTSNPHVPDLIFIGMISQLMAWGVITATQVPPGAYKTTKRFHRHVAAERTKITQSFLKPTLNKSVKRTLQIARSCQGKRKATRHPQSFICWKLLELGEVNTVLMDQFVMDQFEKESWTSPMSDISSIYQDLEVSGIVVMKQCLENQIVLELSDDFERLVSVVRDQDGAVEQTEMIEEAIRLTDIPGNLQLAGKLTGTQLGTDLHIDIEHVLSKLYFEKPNHGYSIIHILEILQRSNLTGEQILVELEKLCERRVLEQDIKDGLKHFNIGWHFNLLLIIVGSKLFQAGNTDVMAWHQKTHDENYRSIMDEENTLGRTDPAAISFSESGDSTESVFKPDSKIMDVQITFMGKQISAGTARMFYKKFKQFIDMLEVDGNEEIWQDGELRLFVESQPFTYREAKEAMEHIVHFGLDHDSTQYVA